MTGFTPGEIRVKADSIGALDWWAQESALHLGRGVHTLVSYQFGLREELPAESRRALKFTVPTEGHDRDPRS